MADRIILALIIVLYIVIFHNIHQAYINETRENIPSGVDQELYWFLVKKFGSPISDGKILLWTNVDPGYTQLILNDVLVASAPFCLFAGYNNIQPSLRAYRQRIGQLLEINDRLYYDQFSNTITLKANTWSELVEETYRAMKFSYSGLRHLNMLSREKEKEKKEKKEKKEEIRESKKEEYIRTYLLENKFC
jgi:hypothetical protein